MTGGAGFIGSHIVDALVREGADVTCVDSLDAGVYDRPPPYLNSKATYRFADLRIWDPDRRDCDVEAVVHLAALGGVSRASRQPVNVVEGNVIGTARLVEAMRAWPRLSRVVVASSFSVYGSSYRYRCTSCGMERNGDRRREHLEARRYEVVCDHCAGDAEVLPLGESGQTTPLELYGASKLMQELCFIGFDACPVTILRQSSVYGRRLRCDDGEATIIARIAGWVRAGNAPPLFEDGKQIRDWVNVEDIVAAVAAILNGVDAPAIVNACTGVPVSLWDACRIVALAVGSRCEPVVVGGYRAGDMRHCLGDPTSFARLLGRSPQEFTVSTAAPLGAT